MLASCVQFPVAGSPSRRAAPRWCGRRRAPYRRPPTLCRRAGSCRCGTYVRTASAMLLPRGLTCIGVDDLNAGVRRIERGQLVGAAAVEELARSVLNSRAVLHVGVAHAREALVVDIEDEALAGFRRDVEDLAVGHEVAERVLLLVEHRRVHIGEQGPHVGLRVVDLRRVGPRGTGERAADRQDPPVGEHGDRGIPAWVVHVGDACPGVGRGIEDVRVADPGALRHRPRLRRPSGRRRP